MNRATTTLADRLVQARERCELRQDKVASLAGMTQQSYSDLERGVSKRTTRIGSLARILRVDAYWLETGEGESRAHVVNDAAAAYGSLSGEEWALLTAIRQLAPRQQRGLMDLLGVDPSA